MAAGNLVALQLISHCARHTCCRPGDLQQHGYLHHRNHELT